MMTRKGADACVTGIDVILVAFKGLSKTRMLRDPLAVPSAPCVGERSQSRR